MKIGGDALSILAGVLLGVGSLAIKEALFPEVSGILPGLVFIALAYYLGSLAEK
jgi:lipopolysaccharide export LptBFGC system permease protein LptF